MLASSRTSMLRFSIILLSLFYSNFLQSQVLPNRGFINDKKSEYSISKESDNSQLLNKIVINEVFYVHEMDGFLKKDFWVEIINVSSVPVDINGISLTTDELYGKAPVISRSDTSRLPLLSPGKFISINIRNKYNLKPSYYSQPVFKSPTIFLYKGEQLLDSITVEPLNRDESFGRYPDGAGDFIHLKYETPGSSNDQILPGQFSKPNVTFIHSLGLGATNFKIENFDEFIKPRVGAQIYFGIQKSHRLFDSRIFLGYLRRSYELDLDTNGISSFGITNTNIEGIERATYLSYAHTIGVFLYPKLKLWLGGDIDFRLTSTSTVDGRLTLIRNNGEIIISDFEFDRSAIIPEDIDANLSVEIEYNLHEKIFINVGYHVNVLGINFNSADRYENRVRNKSLHIQFILPIFESDRLKRKSFLFYRQKNN